MGQVPEVRGQPDVCLVDLLPWFAGLAGLLQSTARERVIAGSYRNGSALNESRPVFLPTPPHG